MEPNKKLFDKIVDKIVKELKEEKAEDGPDRDCKGELVDIFKQLQDEALFDEIKKQGISAEEIKNLMDEVFARTLKKKRHAKLCYSCRKKLGNNSPVFRVEIYHMSDMGDTFSSDIFLDSKDLEKAIVDKLKRTGRNESE